MLQIANPLHNRHLLKMRPWRPQNFWQLLPVLVASGRETSCVNTPQDDGGDVAMLISTRQEFAAVSKAWLPDS